MTRPQSGLSVEAMLIESRVLPKQIVLTLHPPPLLHSHTNSQQNQANP
jgi:hypothetical protein